MVVLAECRGRDGRLRGGAVEARVGRLLQVRAGHRVVDLDEVAAGGHVRVGDDVGGAVGQADGHAVAHAHLLDLPGRHGGHPVGDQPVDGVTVVGPGLEGSPPWVVGQLGAAHGPAQAAEVGVGSGHDAHRAAVGRRVVVEWSRVGQPVALPVADEPEAVVTGHRPLQGAQDRAVERGVDHPAAPGAAAGPVPPVEGGDHCLGGEGAGEVVGDGDAGTHGRPVGIAGDGQEAAVGDAHPVEARADRRRGRPDRRR